MPRKKTQKKIKENSVEVDIRAYGQEALRQAAAIWEKKAQVFVESASKNRWRVSLETQGGALPSAATEEFLNEALNQRYRQIVGAFNKNIARRILVQALYSASQPAPKDAAAALEPDVERQRAEETQALLAQARQEFDKSRSA